MNVLIACEFSGVVRDAFRAWGHNAVSCDLRPTEVEGPHWQGDVREILGAGWDLMIGHPPCTNLAVSGARWFKYKAQAQKDALIFFHELWTAEIPRIALENPVGVVSTEIARPTQIIQPFQFGHPETKATCLWLKGLPKLLPTCLVSPDEGSRVANLAPGPEREKERSRTYLGIARAMAEQWGKF